MRKILIALTFVILAYSDIYAQNLEIIPGESAINYLKKEADGNSEILQEIEVEVAYYYTGSIPVSDAVLSFTIDPSTLVEASLSPVLVNIPVGGFRIPKDSFALNVKKKKLKLTLQTKAVNPLKINDYFSITLSGAAPGSLFHRVKIIKEAPPATPPHSKSISITHIPQHIAFNPLIKDAPNSARRFYSLRYEIKGELERDTVIHIELYKNSGNEVRPQLVRDSFKIVGTSDKTGSVIIAMEINSVKNFGDSENVYISFKGSPIADEIVFTRAGMINPNKPFWIEVGSNFDFIDGLQPNNFFSGVFLHKRDVANFRPDSTLKTFKRKENGKLVDNKYSVMKFHPKRIAIFAGVYQSKAISTLDESWGTLTYYDPATAPKFPTDSVGLYTDTGIIKNIQVIKNVSLFFSPQYRITSKPANADGLHVFASGWSEIQWQKINVESDYSGLVRRDTTLRIPQSHANFHLKKPVNKTLDIKTHYLGIGLPIYFREGDVNLYINPVFGGSNLPKESELQPYFDNQLKKFSELKRIWRAFYVLQFRLNEERYGFAFTGEIRGLLIKNNAPYISMALSKKFDLNKFLEFK